LYLLLSIDSFKVPVASLFLFSINGSSLPEFCFPKMPPNLVFLRNRRNSLIDVLAVCLVLTLCLMGEGLTNGASAQNDQREMVGIFIMRLSCVQYRNDIIWFRVSLAF
jgi:hypothetical protein